MPQGFVTLHISQQNMTKEEISFDYIKRLTYNFEGVDVEFKETTGQLNRGMEALCGMINGDGGIVVFVISNKGKIIGQQIADKTTREIGEALRKFEPAIDLQPKYIKLPESDNYLIVFSADGVADDKPYLWDGKAYQRHDSVTSVMPREKQIRIREQQHGLVYNWESKTNHSLTLDMLDEHQILIFVQGAIRRGRLVHSAMSENIESILNRLKLSNNGSLKNAAAILFGKELDTFPQCALRLARFKGIDKKEFIDNQRIEGNIFELVDAAMSFFFKHLSLSGTTHRLTVRKDELEVPYDALREALVNSLCHRAWHLEASTIGIAIFDDRIEIENAGRFPKSISPNTLINNEEHNYENTSLPPNPIIANVMFLGGLIENWGRGLSMMFDECIKAGLAAPIILDNGNFVKVIFKRNIDGLRTQVGVKQDSSRSEVDVEFENVSASILRLIDILGEEWLSTAELLERLEFKSRSTFRKNYLLPAIADSFIEMQNPASPNAPNQKYGLTLLGKKLYYRYK